MSIRTRSAALVVPLTLFIAVLLSTPRTLRAADYYWTGAAGDSDWNRPENWSDQVVPGYGDRVFINKGVVVSLGYPDDHATCRALTIGEHAGDSGTVLIPERASISVYEQVIGDAGTGLLQQVNGDNRDSSNIVLGRQETGVGRYEISAGWTKTGNLVLGARGRGTVVQSGESFVEAGTLWVGSDGRDYYHPTAGRGWYELSGTGQLTAYHAIVGGVGIGTFIQTGGTNNTRRLEVDSTSGTPASYELSGTGFLKVSATGLDKPPEVIGGAGSGSFLHAGGTHQLDNYPLTGHPSGLLVKPQTLYLGRDAGSSGTYELSSGTLAAPIEIVGYKGTGRFEHSGGLNNCDTLNVGHSAGGTGTYRMSGDARLQARVLTVAMSSDASMNPNPSQFVHASGEVITESLSIGPSSLGFSYELRAPASLVADRESIQGVFHQIGARHSAGVIDIGSSKSAGSYLLSGGGELNCGPLYVRNGTFDHVSGKATVGYLYVGSDVSWGPPRPTLYTLRENAHLQATGIRLGDGDDGQFEQLGGRLSAASNAHFEPTLEVARGSYRLVDGDLEMNEAVIGSWGDGVFTQAGGRAAFGNVTLAEYSNSTGSLQVSGTARMLVGGDMHVGYAGTASVALSADLRISHNLFLGYEGNGRVTQSAGLHAAKSVVIGGGRPFKPSGTGTGEYVMSGGEFQADSVYVGYGGPGTFRITGPDARLVVSTLFGLYKNSTFEAVPGSMIRCRGALVGITSEDPASVAGWSNLTLLFEGGKEGRMDVSSRFGGGFDSNFALGGLVLGGEGYGNLRLQDFADSGNRSPGLSESLFVHSLSIRDDSRLDLAGLAVFVEGNVADQVDAWIRGGNIIDSKIVPGFFLDAVYNPDAHWTLVSSFPVPEPAGVTTLLLLFALRARARRWSGV